MGTQPPAQFRYLVQDDPAADPADRRRHPRGAPLQLLDRRDSVGNLHDHADDRSCAAERTEPADARGRSLLYRDRRRHVCRRGGKGRDLGEPCGAVRRTDRSGGRR